MSLQPNLEISALLHSCTVHRAEQQGPCQGCLCYAERLRDHQAQVLSLQREITSLAREARSWRMTVCRELLLSRCKSW
jgi:hypothetical protein